ncbi:MAG: CoA pyrophosphatase [Elusimicrobiota bacterium]|jgi:8-oxo-dGTP pyrophosphatase MutT (NUDIX family)
MLPVPARLRDAVARRPSRRILIPGFARAAVLVPVVERTGGWSLVFTERSSSLALHAGQVSFPGGRREAEDPSLTATALRESAEEMGLSSERVAVLGRLDDVAVYTGFVVTPVVGWLGSGRAFTPDRREVRRIFELPLADLADLACFSYLGTRDVAGEPHPLYEFRHCKARVWGATARMVYDLLGRLGWPAAFRA